MTYNILHVPLHGNYVHISKTTNFNNVYISKTLEGFFDIFIKVNDYVGDGQ